MNKCIKLILKDCENMNIQNIKQIIRNMNYLSCKAANEATSMWREHTFKMIKMKNENKDFDEINYIKDKYNKNGYTTVVDEVMKNIMNICNTGNVGTLHKQQVQNDWNKLKQEILKYNKKSSEYKLDTPYYFKNNSYELFTKTEIDDNKKTDYFINLSFFSNDGFKSMSNKYEFKKTSGHYITFKIDKFDDGNKSSTIKKMLKGRIITKDIKTISDKLNIFKKDREKYFSEIEILEKELKKTQENFNTLYNQGVIYKQGSAQIKISKKGKIELTISFSFEPQKEIILNSDRILGVDLGIVNTATMQIYDSIEQKWDWLNWKECMISGQELIHFRQKIQTRKKQLQIASKCVGEGRIGHGINTRMKPVNDIGDKEARFKDTFNHKVSKYIVDMAVKHNCGTIQMENLSGFSGQQHERFLKEWSYSDIQTKVKYKAEEKGIIVNLINPQYTSKRCSKCGCIHNDNRNCKENQGKFECVVCGHKENADINAAKNISLPGIEVIIEEQLKINKEEELKIS